MSRLTTIACVALFGVAATACASMDRQTARAEARTLLAQAPTEASQHAYDVVGLTNYSYGDRWIGANMMERAQTAHDSVGARFNLATAYYATGRLPQAAAIYRTLLTDGQYKWAITRRDAYHEGPARKFNIAEESARRLADIDARLRFAQAAPSGGALSAAEAGTAVAAVVGGQAPNGRISDAEAFRRDNLANPPAF
jgi:hypothetical protein